MIELSVIPASGPCCEAVQLHTPHGVFVKLIKSMNFTINTCYFSAVLLVYFENPNNILTLNWWICFKTEVLFKIWVTCNVTKECNAIYLCIILCIYHMCMQIIEMWICWPTAEKHMHVSDSMFGSFRVKLTLKKRKEKEKKRHFQSDSLWILWNLFQLFIISRNE